MSSKDETTPPFLTAGAIYAGKTKDGTRYLRGKLGGVRLLIVPRHRGLKGDFTHHLILAPHFRRGATNDDDLIIALHRAMHVPERKPWLECSDWPDQEDGE